MKEVCPLFILMAEHLKCTKKAARHFRVLGFKSKICAHRRLGTAYASKIINVGERSQRRCSSFEVSHGRFSPSTTPGGELAALLAGSGKYLYSSKLLHRHRNRSDSRSCPYTDCRKPKHQQFLLPIRHQSCLTVNDGKGD